jgi:YD repeat-containing protein
VAQVNGGAPDKPILLVWEARKTNQQNAATENYTYDAIYQLTQVVQGANTTESYSYDKVGNRTASQLIGGRPR